MATVAEAKTAKERHRGELSALPNVVGLGVGPKVSHGQATGEIAIKVFVSRLVPLESLEPEERIPAELDGIPTDVEVLAPLRARESEGEESRDGSKKGEGQQGE